MPTYPPHVLLAWGGTLHGVDEWVQTLRLVPNSGQVVSDATLQTFLAELETELKTCYASAYFHSGLTLDYAKANSIGPDGKYVSKSTSNTRVFATPGRGTATAAMPAQVAIVATLQTDAARGLASRGRMYFGGLSREYFGPAPVDGLISPTAVTEFTGHVRTLLLAINDNPGLDAEFGGLDVHVVSGGGLSGPGVARKVTSVKVGRVLDTQRRRREALPESYGAPLAIS